MLRSVAKQGFQIAFPIVGISRFCLAKVNQLKAGEFSPRLKSGLIYRIWIRLSAPEDTLTAAAQRPPEIAGQGVTIVCLLRLVLADTLKDPQYYRFLNVKWP